MLERQELCSHFSHHVRRDVLLQVGPFSCSTINTPLILISGKSKTLRRRSTNTAAVTISPLLFEATALFVKVRSKRLNDAQRKDKWGVAQTLMSDGKRRITTLQWLYSDYSYSLPLCVCQPQKSVLVRSSVNGGNGQCSWPALRLNAAWLF